MILIFEREENQTYIGVPVSLTACTLSHNVTRPHSAGLEKIYNSSLRCTSSNCTKICQMTENMYVYFQAGSLLTQWNKSCCNLCYKSCASHRGGLRSIPAHFMRDLWWRVSRWGRICPSTSVSSVNSYFTKRSTSLSYHMSLVQWDIYGASTKGLCLTPL
jgi:hypothetical protein